MLLKSPPLLRVLRSVLALALICAFTVAGSQEVPWRVQIAASPDAQTLPEDRGAAGLAQTLRKLDTWASLMFTVAHPDDEDGGMMAFESRGMGARTAIMTLTRGEGGQNAMSGESYDALGLIRTNELLLADQYSGSEQYFATVADYGFSKTKEEALQLWGHDRVLCDVVRAVRMYHPLVLASTFTGNITDGHGQHQVSGEVNQEAFSAAGDPSVCPDQIAAGLRPWSPLKVYARAPFFPASNRGIFDYATNKWSPGSLLRLRHEAMERELSHHHARNPRGHLGPDPRRVVLADCSRRLGATEVPERRGNAAALRSVQRGVPPLRLGGEDDRQGRIPSSTASTPPFPALRPSHTPVTPPRWSPGSPTFIVTSPLPSPTTCRPIRRRSLRSSPPATRSLSN